MTVEAPKILNRLTDRHGRTINYLRLSITDLCNLRCFYCMPAEIVEKLPHSEILRYEECVEVVRIAASMGVSKVRVTGGEPLVKRGVVNLVERIAACTGVKTVALTTNGSALAKFAPRLRDAGLTRVNVSLDTLDARLYRRITGRGELNDVLAGIDAALTVGFAVKVNAVLLPGLNTDDLEPFVALARAKNIEVRFIERMTFKHDDDYFTQDQALDQLSVNHRIKPLVVERPSPHVRLFDCDGARIGFISPRSQPFCDGCNKLRLTPHGQLRACLASNLHVDVRKILRRPHTDEDIRQAIRQATVLKPHSGPWNTEAEMWRVGG